MSSWSRSPLICCYMVLSSVWAFSAGAQAQDANAPKPPDNTVVTNPDPVVTTEIGRPSPNKDLGKAKSATNALARRLAEELEDRLLDYVDEYEEELKRVAFSDLERDDILEKFKKENRDPKLLEQLESALIDLDPLAVQRACKKMELPTAEMTSLVSRVEVTSTFTTLEKKVSDGESALTVSRLARKLQRDLKAVDMPQGKRIALFDLAELIVAGVRIRDAVEGNTIRGLPLAVQVDWPVGQVPVVFYPRIPKGQVFVLGGDCLVAGTDNNSDIVFGVKTVAEAMHLPVYIDVPPVPNDNADGRPQSGVVIRNPDDTGATISYRIDTATNYKTNNNVMTVQKWQSIAPGQRHPYPGPDAYVVEFNQGPGRGVKPYTLRDGTFEFFASEQGWNLRPNSYEVTIDNGDSPNDFHYIVDNRRSLVPAGGTRKHTSNYPMVIRFDRGGGTGLVTKVLDKTGSGRVWKIGVNVETNYWDLFSTDDISVVSR